MKDTSLLEAHYQKFNEEKRLTRRHGQVEYLTTLHYIHHYLNQLSQPRETIQLLDIGCGTGRYAVSLADCGYDVSAIELIKYNVGVLKAKKSSVKAYQGNALNLKKFKDGQFDVCLLLGPMYHLFELEDKVQALNEAKRVTKKGGLIFVAYLMNEYGVLVHGFRDQYIHESIKNQKLDRNFHIQNSKEDLYDYVRIEDIDHYNTLVGIKRLQMISATGAANYMRSTLNAMDEETFALFMKYHLSTCERADLMGASSHVVDILTVE
ncbi:MAG: class I SAM-dependent methyltransferase [Erysipelotrichaceae bacterium]